MNAYLRKFDPYLRKVSRRVITAAALAFVGVLGTVDSATGTQFSLAIFYLLPIAFATWYGGKTNGLFTASASAITWLVADFAASGGFSHPTIPFWESLVRLSLFLIVVYLLTAVKRLNENLEAAVEQKTAALHAEMKERSRVERAVLEISGQEQRRIAHELHDGLGQVLTYSALKTKMLADDLTAESLPQALHAEEIVGLLNQGTQQIRHLARGLDPIDVEASGLSAALDRLIKDTESLGHIRCSFTFSQVEVPLGTSASLQLYRIAQESINNAVKNGKATSLEIELNISATRVSLKVTDDGVGFCLDEAKDSGMGIRIMRYRAGSLGGVLTISSAPEEGTTVHCVVPVAQHEQFERANGNASSRNAKETHSSC
jgi:signal transduction histidine kinase